VHCLGWASILSHPSTPAGPVSSSPAWAGGEPISAVGRQVLLTRLGFPAPSVQAVPTPVIPGVGRCSASPAGPVGRQTPAGPASLAPSRPAPRWACHFTMPGWAGSGGSGLAGILLQATFYQFRLGRTPLAQAGLPPCQAGLLLVRPGFLSLGRLIPSWAEIYLLWDILLIRHRLHRLVPVLGCL
jgi:hypothetical protein